METILPRTGKEITERYQEENFRNSGDFPPPPQLFWQPKGEQI